MTWDNSTFWRVYRNTSYQALSSSIRTLEAQLCFRLYLLIKYLATVFHTKGRTIFSTEDTDKSGTIKSSKKSQDNKGGRQEQYCIRAASICIPGSKLRPGDTRTGKSQVQTFWRQSPAGRGSLIERKRTNVYLEMVSKILNTMQKYPQCSGRKVIWWEEARKVQLRKHLPIWT